MIQVEGMERRQLLSASLLDTTFGTNGVVYAVSDPQVLSNGQIIVLGTPGTSSTGGDSDPHYLSRLTSEGTLDPTFGTTAKLSSPNAFSGSPLVDSNGRVIISEITSAGYQEDRILTDGSVDSSFSFTSFMYGGAVGHQLLLVTPNDDFVGTSYTLGVLGTDAVVEFGPDGDNSPALPFRYEPTDLTSPTPAAITADGDILCFDSDGVIRLTPGGDLDSTFGHNGVADVSRSVTAVFPEVNGDVLVNLGSEVVRLTSTGQLDPTFGINGSITIASDTSEAVASDGTIYLGTITPSNGQSIQYAVSRYSKDGLLETNFADGGTVTGTLPVSATGSTTAPTMTVEPAGQLLIASDQALFRLDVNAHDAFTGSTLLPTFKLTGVTNPLTTGNVTTATALVTLTNSGSTTVDGATDITVFVSADGTSTNATPWGSATEAVNLVPGATATYSIPLGTVPDVGAGTYSAVVQVVDPSNATALATSDTPVVIQRAAGVGLLTASAFFSRMPYPITLTAGSRNNGRFLLTLNNPTSSVLRDNVTLNVTAQPVLSGSIDQRTAATLFTRRLHVVVRAGKSVSLPVPFGRVPNTLLGSYELVTNLLDHDENALSAIVGDADVVAASPSPVEKLAYHGKTSLAAGDTATLVDIIQNQGTGTGGGELYLNVEASQSLGPGNYGKSYPLSTTGYPLVLRPGQKHRFVVRVQFPPSLPAGRYVLSVSAQFANKSAVGKTNRNLTLT